MKEYFFLFYFQKGTVCNNSLNACLKWSIVQKQTCQVHGASTVAERLLRTLFSYVFPS